MLVGLLNGAGYVDAGGMPIRFSNPRARMFFYQVTEREVAGGVAAAAAAEAPRPVLPAPAPARREGKGAAAGVRPGERVVEIGLPGGGAGADITVRSLGDLEKLKPLLQRAGVTDVDAQIINLTTELITRAMVARDGNLLPTADVFIAQRLRQAMERRAEEARRREVAARQRQAPAAAAEPQTLEQAISALTKALRQHGVDAQGVGAADALQGLLFEQHLVAIDTFKIPVENRRRVQELIQEQVRIWSGR